MKFKQVITVIGLGASLAAATTACGTKEEAVTTMAETETVAETETETQATESETETLKDEGISDEDIREELERHKEEIQKAGYDHKSVGFVEYYKGLRLNGTDENKAVADTIVHFDELNSAMGELETETQTGEVYVSGTPVGEEVGTGSNATSGELSEEQIAAEEAARAQTEAQKKVAEEAQKQAEAQAEAQAQTPAQEQPVVQEQPAITNVYDESQWTDWDREVMEGMDKSNPNYGTSGKMYDGTVSHPECDF